MTDPEQRRAVFGERLRVLREDAGYLTAKEFAHRLGWHPSKVSRVENGRLSITENDVAAWATAAGVPDAADELKEDLYAVALEENRWKRQLRDGHRTRQQQSQQVERDASLIRVFELAVVPGLVQTAEYARYVFMAGAELHQTPRDTSAAVQARMQRQNVLYDEGKTIELLIAESALRYPVCPPEVMTAQIDRMLALAGLPSVRLGILPLGAQLVAVPMHGFWIVDDQVRVETIDSEMHSRDPKKHALYTRLLDSLWSVAAEGEDARVTLANLARG